MLGFRRCVAIAGAAIVVGALGFQPQLASAANPTPIQHVIIIIQENRSFDHYFGTFPGANGIPQNVCQPLVLGDASQGCVAPWHDVHDLQVAANHSGDTAQYDMDDGITTSKMDGFAANQMLTFKKLCTKSNGWRCQGEASGFTEHDVMGYHTADEIPNYWAYAQNFALQDMMFPGMRAWSTPSHIDMTSEWVALCSNENDASTCRTSDSVPNAGRGNGVHYPYASLFQLMDMKNVSWKYYRTNGLDPDCVEDESTCEPDNVVKQPQSDVWNPPALFTYVRKQGDAYMALHNPTSDQFWADIKGGTLPQVSWIVPNGLVSEHPFASGVTAGMEYVTAIVNEVMQSNYWNSTAIFIVWDDWGAFYDHVIPPTINFADPLVNTSKISGFAAGMGLRVPGIVISPWVKPHQIDHSVLSFASYATFIEDIFMDGTRLDPVAMGVPDSRSDIRDALTTVTYADGSTAPVGKIINEFDFSQTPLPKLILSTAIPINIRSFCHGNMSNRTYSCTDANVTITWDDLVGPNVPGPYTYHVTRDGTDLPKCVGSTTTCTDKPGSGVHYYRVYSVDSNNVQSPPSAATEADEP